MASRLLNQATTYFDNAGQPVAGGRLYFYQNGSLVTPKAVYGDKLLTANLGVTEDLDAAGRQVNDIWLNGTYTVVLKDADGVQVWARDDVETPSDLPSPVGETGKALISDGSEWVATEFEQLPSPAGGDNGDVLTIVAGEWAAAAPTPQGDFAGGEVSDAVLVNVREKTQAVTATATTTIDYSLGAVVLLAQAVDITSLVFTNFGASGETATMTIVRTKDNSATARTIAWGSVLFPGGTAPTLTQTANAVDVITLVSTNGTQILGYSAADFS